MKKIIAMENGTTIGYLAADLLYRKAMLRNTIIESVKLKEL
jgi:hypothetical protein